MMITINNSDSRTQTPNFIWILIYQLLSLGLQNHNVATNAGSWSKTPSVTMTTIVAGECKGLIQSKTQDIVCNI